MKTGNKRGPKSFVPSEELKGMIKHHNSVKNRMDEKTRRHSLGHLACVGGPRSFTYIAKETHSSRSTIKTGMDEVQKGDSHPDRIRKPGGGRKSKTDDPLLCAAVESLAETAVYGNPCNDHKYTSLSLRKIVELLDEDVRNMTNRITTSVNQQLSILVPEQFHMAMESLRSTRALFHNSPTTIGKVLKKIGYSKKKNRKLEQCTKPHPKQNEQMEHIADLKEAALDCGIPAVSIDCKKHEKVGNFKNEGTIYTPAGKPIDVEDHDFADVMASPYGIYDISRNQGYVVVGTSSDTAEFAANVLDSWMENCLPVYYEGARELIVFADGGGSNGSRNRMWKIKLQELADKHGVDITVCHFPPGKSKYNYVEHRLFSQISMNWSGVPLRNIETMVNYISSTTTTTGLSVECYVDPEEYLTQKAKKKLGLPITTPQDLEDLDLEFFGPAKGLTYTIYARA